MTAPGIVGMGFALPAHAASQRAFAEFFIDTLGLAGDDASFVRVIARKTGVDRRHAVILDRTAEGDAPLAQSFYTAGADRRIPTTGNRMAAFMRWAPPLAADAARAALRDAAPLGLDDPASITHLITFSCTGFAAPGVDAALIRALELRRTVHRTHIGFMGCHAAINALRIARALVAADPTQVVLMVGVELSSIHLIDGTRRDQLVAACLFGDGAAAAVIAADSRAPVRILDTASMVLPDTTGAMGWTIGDHGFEMMLAEDVPAHIGRNIASWLDAWLEHHDGGLAATRTNAVWCVHPGGPRVLEAVGEALALPDHALDHSRAVLRKCGNMSSVTTLFILDRIRASHRDATEDRRVVALGFGPGLAGEAVLVELRAPRD